MRAARKYGQKTEVQVIAIACKKDRASLVEPCP